MENNKIISVMNDPDKLEELYQSDKNTFNLWLEKAIAKYPNSETLKVWDARLNYPAKIDMAAYPSIVVVVVLCFVSGFLVKLPAFFPLDGRWFYPRFVPIIVISSLIAYFFRRIDESRVKVGLVIGIAFCLFVLFLLPDKPNSSSINMSLIHMPLVLVSLLAIAFTGSEWKSAEARLSYVRYLGEVIVYSIIILLGGMVLTGLTLGLFNLIEINIQRFYTEYIVVLGMVSSPLVATYLYDNVLSRGSRISTIISNVFSPLFFVTVISYLVAVLYQGRSPYVDRGFLVTFNGLLVVVWAITVFSISGIEKEGRGGFLRKINIALVLVTLIVDAIAMSAIIFRLTEYGVTPNRIAVTGANILIFVNLVLILIDYLGYIRLHKSYTQLNDVISNYLPVYSFWSLFVVIGLPLIFLFK